MASELADADEHARMSLAGLFNAWEGLLAAGLRRMQDKGALRRDADPDQRDIRPMEIALDLALSHIKSYLTE
jgi:hypothetical protein